MPRRRIAVHSNIMYRSNFLLNITPGRSIIYYYYLLANHVFSPDDEMESTGRGEEENNSISTYVAWLPSHYSFATCAIYALPDYCWRNIKLIRKNYFSHAISFHINFFISSASHRYGEAKNDVLIATQQTRKKTSVKLISHATFPVVSNAHKNLIWQNKIDSTQSRKHYFRLGETDYSYFILMLLQVRCHNKKDFHKNYASKNNLKHLFLPRNAQTHSQSLRFWNNSFVFSTCFQY